MSASKDDRLLEDYLDEDPEIAGQKYALLSFISPENVLQRKDQFFFERFLRNYEISWKVKNLEQFLAKTVTDINEKLIEHSNKFERDGHVEVAETCRTSQIRIDDVMAQYQAYVAKNQREINATRIAEEYKDYMFREQARLEDEFHSANDFRTTVRGLKVRGVVRDEREAQARVKKLQAHDKIHNIFLAEVGKWTPWDPAPSNVADQEYAQEELNTLMKKYKENEQTREQFFEEQRKAKKPAGGAGAAAGGGGGQNKVIEVLPANAEDASGNTGVSESAPAPVVAPAPGPAPVSSHDSLFDAPGDLALQRRMERQNTGGGGDA
jgi:hypothetical protein